MAFHSGRPFSANDVTSSDTLLQHAAKIVKINRPFLLLNNRLNAVFEVIDRFHLGVLVLDSANRILLANSAAEAILDTADGVKRGEGQKLQGCLEQSSNNLATAIKGLDSQQGTVEFSIPRLTEKIDYVAELSTLSSRLLDSSPDTRLLVITDPERDDIVNLSGIGKIYQLSDAEKEVANRIVTGNSYKEIAEIRGVSPETVKVQVASILRKTGCKNRTEIVCLAHRASIPVDQL
jgi:DNA-binding CsgD family transcriptional regulator